MEFEIFRKTRLLSGSIMTRSREVAETLDLGIQILRCLIARFFQPSGWTYQLQNSIEGRLLASVPLIAKTSWVGENAKVDQRVAVG